MCPDAAPAMTRPPPTAWSLPQPQRVAATAVLFLLRGRDAHHEASARRFLESYRRHPAGLAHDLILICKGFDAPEAQARAEAAFADCAARVLTVADDSFDLGAYRAAAELVAHERVCFLNTHAEILSSDWLLKLALNLDQPGIGMVGCTGSYEQLLLDRPIRPFPNVHLRSNGFLLGRRLFLDVIGDRPIREKEDAFMVESGPASLTQGVLARGLGVLIVGADARGYPPRLWPRSRTFRLGAQDNLLVGDNQTRAVAAYPWRVRAAVARATWKHFLAELPPEASAPASRDLAPDPA